MIKTCSILMLMILCNRTAAQIHQSFGLTGSTLNVNGSAGGGFSYSWAYNLWEIRNSSISLGTNLKLGIQDKIGSGIIIPLLLLAASEGSGNITYNPPGGGTIHLYADLPLVLHYNFGLGANTSTMKHFGFYMGGGIGYTTSGYADSAGYSRPLSYFGLIMDGGIRFLNHTDLNLLFEIPIGSAVIQINHPLVFGLTISKSF